MVAYYLDTSSLVKLYMDEVGSLWLNNILDESVLLTAEISMVEVVSAFNRRVREGAATAEGLTVDNPNHHG
jgi:predicted nucleic acid-binding protein